MKFLSPVAISFIAPSVISAKAEKKYEYNTDENYEYKSLLLNSELKNVNKITNKNNKIIFTKEIYDLIGNRYLLIIFDNCNSIIDLDTMITVEINFLNLKDSIITNKDKDIIYLGSSTLLFRENKNQFIDIHSKKIIKKEDLKYKKILNINDEDIKEIRNQNLIKRKKQSSSISEFSFRNKGSSNNYKTVGWKNKSELNVSTQVPYSWWFATRDYSGSAGYDEYNGNGLCEYVALSQLLLYNELFINGGIFTEEQYNNYIIESNSDNIYYSSPEFKYHYFNSKEKSLTYDLFKIGGKKYNLKTGRNYEYITKNFIKDKHVLNNLILSHKYGGYYRAWESVKNGTPAILGVATFKNFNHAMIVYGYEDSTDMFLASYCWGNSDTNRVLFSYYTNAWGSYYFNIKSHKGSSDLKKSFIYKNNKYTGKEIDTILKQN